MQRAVSVLEEVADPERNPAPSQQPHPAWRLDLPVDKSDTGPQRLNRLKANALRFLSQGINGGTEAALKLIVGILFTPQLLTIQAPFDSGGGSSSSLVISGGGSSSSALRSGSASNVTVFVIFDGKGRLKNSVKRSLRNFDKVNVDRVQVDDPDAKCAARTAATPARARTARTAATAAMAATAGTKGTASTAGMAGARNVEGMTNSPAPIMKGDGTGQRGSATSKTSRWAWVEV
jgi:hypothetical protein